jgi:hypothetical protein
MSEPLSEQIMRQISQTVGLYHRLVLVVAPAGVGKTAALQEVAKQTGYRYINVNLELSRRMLELTQRQRQLQASRLLQDLGRTSFQTKWPSDSQRWSSRSCNLHSLPIIKDS